MRLSGIPSRIVRLGLTSALLAAGCATSPNARRPGTAAEWRAEMQPPLAEEQAGALADELTLLEAVVLGAERNPAVAAARNRWLAAIHTLPQATTPPDPMLEGEFQFESFQSLAGPLERSFGLTQPIPWPKKLWLAGRVSATDAEIMQIEYEAALRDLVIDVKDAYYELYYLDQAIPVTEKIEGMFRNDAILAYSELTVGRTQLNEAFRAESQAAELAYDRILLEEQRAAQSEQLRTLLNLPPGSVIGPVRTARVYPVTDSFDALCLRSEQFAELLRIRGLETQRAAYETTLAKLSRIPDVNLGFSYIDMKRPGTSDEEKARYRSELLSFIGGEGDGAYPERPRREANPEDPFLGLVSMNLPLFEWRNRALVQEQKALEAAMRLDALSSVNQVRAAVAQAYFQVRLTERLLRLYDDTLLPQAESVMRQAEVFFRTDQASFANVLETTIAYHNFLLARLRALADHGQAIGQLERVVGSTAEHREDTDQPSLDVEENPQQ